MNVELVVPPSVPAVSELVVDVSIVNRGPKVVRLSTLLLDLPSVVLQVRRADGAPVPKSPPPVPPLDDGVSGRQVLAPGEALTLRFRGPDLLAIDPGPGEYELRYAIDLVAAPGSADWAGSLASPWVPFAIRP
jgi:hypothetical protein